MAMVVAMDGVVGVLVTAEVLVMVVVVVVMEVI